MLPDRDSRKQQPKQWHLMPRTLTTALERVSVHSDAALHASVHVAQPVPNSTGALGGMRRACLVSR